MNRHIGLSAFLSLLALVAVSSAASAQYFSNPAFPIYGQYSPLDSYSAFYGRTPYNAGYFSYAPQNPPDFYTQNALAAQAAQDQAAYQNTIPRTPESIDARIQSDGRLLISWSGNTDLARSVTFSLLDKNRKMLKTAILMRTPVQTRFTLSNKTAYYKVVVEYIDGTMTQVVSPL